MFIKEHNRIGCRFYEKLTRHRAETVTEEFSIQTTRNLMLPVHNTYGHSWSLFRFRAHNASRIKMIVIKGEAALNYYFSEGIVNILGQRSVECLRSQ